MKGIKYSGHLATASITLATHTLPLRFHFSKQGGLTSCRTYGALAKMAVPRGHTANAGEGGGDPDHTEVKPREEATLAKAFFALGATLTSLKQKT